jgi:superfamily II DNA or RNA helicase
LDTLFLTMPVSWKGAMVQYTGRLHRLYPGKHEVRIYDYVDRGVPVLARMFERRLGAYRSIGYMASQGQGSLFSKTTGTVGPDPQLEPFDLDAEEYGHANPKNGVGEDRADR